MSEFIIDFHDGNFKIEPVEHNGEIVRCRDCRHYHEGMCMLSDGMGDFKLWYVDADGFCSDGERAVGA